MSNAGLGVPVKLLHESLGHVITVELKTGQLYRGKLAEGSFARFPHTTVLVHPLPAAEDNLNIALKDITVTGRDGRVSQLDQVYIRGSMIRFFIVPDMLQNAPMSVLSLFIDCGTANGSWIKKVQACRSERHERKRHWYSPWPSYHHARCVPLLFYPFVTHIEDVFQQMVSICPMCLICTR
jgi:small nuclear ribonucleoprotein D3